MLPVCADRKKKTKKKNSWLNKEVIILDIVAAFLS